MIQNRDPGDETEVNETISLHEFITNLKALSKATFERSLKSLHGPGHFCCDCAVLQEVNAIIVGLERLAQPKQPPAPVAWGDLVVGETYWGVPRLLSQRNVPAELTCTEPNTLKSGAGFKFGTTDFETDAEGRPMIYRTPADAVDAMVFALRQWLEGVEDVR